MSHRTFVPILLAAAASLAALAPTPAASEDVSGEFSGAARNMPLARFQDPVCPGIIGLERDFAEMVVYRIRENAKALGLRLADPDSCRVNILVSVLQDGQAYVRDLDHTRPYLFEELSQDQRSALFDAPGKVRSWNRVVVRTRDGLHVDRRENLADLPQTTMEAAHSLIYVPTRRDIIASTVLIDRDAVTNQSVVQLADYATMRALAGHNADSLVKPRGTILSLFDAGGEAPAEMTPADRAFLEALYTSMPNLPAMLTLARARKLIEQGEARD